MSSAAKNKTSSREKVQAHRARLRARGCAQFKSGCQMFDPSPFSRKRISNRWL